MEKKRLIPSSNNLHSKGILNTKLHHQHPLQYLNMLITHQSSIETLLGIFLVVQLVENLTAMQETWVWSLVWEDPLEGDKATHSSILAWRISWTEDPGGPQSTGSKRVGYDWSNLAGTNICIYTTHCILNTNRPSGKPLDKCNKMLTTAVSW